MPVHLDTHNPDIDLTPGTTKSDIVAFLYENPEFGYKPAEIKEHLDIPHGTATTTLTRLHEQGYIGKTKDSYYHALENREDLRRYVASLDQLERLFDHPTDGSDGSTPAATDRSAEDVDDDELEGLVTDLEAELDE